MTVPATVVNTSALPRVIGCDVGKAAVTVFDTLTGQTAAIANHPEALTAFAESLPRDGLVVCEATGGYEAALLVATAAAGVPAHRADARKVKAFIRSLGRIAKTDAIDARALARYGQERHAELARWRPAGGVLDELRTLTRLRSQLVKQRAALANQLKAPGGEVAKNRLQAMRDAATHQITGIEADITTLIGRDPAIAEVVAIIAAIPGCGPVTAVTVAALMPELGMMTGRQAASPPERPARRLPSVRGGRPEVNRALFMAALAARNHNRTLKTVYQRLIANGKKPIVAITALMRKLITIINARIRDARRPPLAQLS